MYCFKVNKLLVAMRLFTLFIILNISSTYATESSIRFGHIGEEDGLSSNLFALNGKLIVQDKLGFLWFGTRNGLNRYDGYQFRTFMHDPKNEFSISGNDITYLFEDSSGFIWVSTTNGLNRFDPKTERFQSNWPIEGLVQSIVEKNLGEYWLATDKGLVLFNSITKNIKRFSHSDKDPSSIVDNNVKVLIQDMSGRLWIGTNKGLDRFDEKSNRFVHYNHSSTNPYSLSHNSVESIFEGGDGTIWIGTRRGMNKYDVKTDSFTRYLTKPLSDLAEYNDISDILEEQQGILWISIKGLGVCSFLVKTGKAQCLKPSISDTSSLRGSVISSLYLDSSGRIWVATVNGLDYFTPLANQFDNIFHNVNVQGEYIEAPVISLLSDLDGFLWVGTYGGGVSRYNKELKEQIDYRYEKIDSHTISSNKIFTIHQDKKGILRIGTSEGLDLYEEKHQHFKRHTTFAKGVATIHDDYQGRIWVSTLDGGLYLLNEITQQFKVIELPKISGLIATIQSDKKNENLWLGSSDGLIRVNLKDYSVQHYQNSKNDPKSLSHNYILSSFLDDENDVLWIGTHGGGLVKFNIKTNEFYQYTRKHGMVSDTVYGIIKDTQNNLWLSTSFGLSKFSLENNSFVNFTTEDGLHENDFSHNAYDELFDGRLAFGTAKGFSVFFPRAVNKMASKHRLLLTDLRVFNQSVPIASHNDENLYSLSSAIHDKKYVELNYDQSFFSFEFAVLNVREPRRVDYYYKLEGWDEYWIETDYTNRLANYTNIPAGDYVLRVKASDQNGAWQDLLTSIEIKINPPLWKTKWAYLSYILFVILIVRLVFWGKSKYEEEHIKAIKDELSGLYSRRYFFEKMKYELKLAKKNHRNFALAFIDLDHFKKINDNLGHQAGDQVIKKVGERLLQTSRTSDHVGRYGGDEFILLINCDDYEIARRIIKRIKSNICRSVLVTPENQIEIEASVGFLWVKNKKVRPIEELIELVDKAVYKSKASGGNNIYEIES